MKLNNDYNRAVKLLSLINEYDEEYFSNNNSLVTDEEYDELWYELRDLMKDEAISKKLNKSSMPLGQQKSHLDKINHLIPVLSLDKLKIDSDKFDKELKKFIEKYGTGCGWVIQSKLDGLTIVIYSKKNEKTFVTRGAGQKGENVTHVFKNIKSIWDNSEKIEDGMIVRGEAIISVHNFKKMLDKLTNERLSYMSTKRFQSFYDSLNESEKEVIDTPDVKKLKELQSQLKKDHKEYMKSLTSKNAITKEKELEKYNQSTLSTYIKLVESCYSNPRNLASASVRTKDLDTANERCVDFVAYDIINSSKFGLVDEMSILKKLESFGFNTVKTKYVLTDDELISFFEKRDELKQSLNALTFRNEDEFEIDGLVIKPNKKIVNPEVSKHHEKGQLAIKFTPQRKESQLLEVIWQEGKNGRLSPVGLFKEVNLGGTKVKKAALGSFDKINEKNLMINDHIIVERSNDVIPQIYCSLPEKRDGNEKKITIPEDSKLVGGIVYLLNYETPLYTQLDKFSKSIGIENVREATYKKIVDGGFMSSLSDLFQLKNKKKDLYNIKGLGKKSIDSLLDEIESVKEHITFYQVVNGLYLTDSGETASNHYVNIVPTYNAYLHSDYDEVKKDLEKISGFSKNQILGLNELYTKQADTLKNIYNAKYGLNRSI